MNNVTESSVILKILDFMGFLEEDRTINRTRRKSRFRLRTWILLLVTHVYTLHCLAYSCQYAFSTGQFSSFFLNIAILSECFVTIFTIDYLLYKNDSLWRFVSFVNNFKTGNVLSSEERKKRKQSVVFTKMVMLFLVIFVSSVRSAFDYWYGFVNLQLDVFIDKYFYGIWILKSYKWVGAVAAFVDTTGYLVTTNLLFLPYIAMAAVGHDLNRKLRDLTHMVQKQRTDPVDKPRRVEKGRVAAAKFIFRLQIQDLCQLHTQTLNLVRSFNDLFGFLFLVWLTHWMVDFFIGVPAVFDSIWRRNYWEIVYFGIKSIIGFILSLLVSFSLADVGTNHSELEKAVHCWVPSIRAKNRRGMAEIRYLVRKISSSSVITRITVSKFFPVTKTFVCELYFAVTSFVIFAVGELAKGSF